MSEFVVEQTNIKNDEVHMDVIKQEIKSPKPIVYANLLAKLRIQVGIVPNTNSQRTNELTSTENTNQKIPNRFRKDGKTNQKTFQKKQDTAPNTTPNTTSNPLPRLSTSEYLDELKKCQKVFFTYLTTYLKEEVSIKVSEPITNSTSNDKKNPIKFIKKTNLLRIQSGSVNIIKVIRELEQDGDIKYLDDLIKNRSMDFVQTLRTQMEKYGIVTTFRNKNTIWIHSPYIIV